MYLPRFKRSNFRSTKEFSGIQEKRTWKGLSVERPNIGATLEWNFSLVDSFTHYPWRSRCLGLTLCRNYPSCCVGTECRQAKRNSRHSESAPAISLQVVCRLRWAHAGHNRDPTLFQYSFCPCTPLQACAAACR